MRILQVTTMYYPELHFGGPPQKIHDLSRGMVGRGHEVRVISINSREPHARYSFEADGVLVTYLPWIGRAPWQAPTSLRPLKNAIEWADVVHCYGLYNLLCPAAVILARLAGKPYIFEPLGMFTPRGRNQPLKRVFNATLSSWMLAGAYRVVATSPAEQADLAGAVPGERIVVRRNGIDLSAFATMPEGRAVRERFRLDPDERLLLYVGRLSPIKNLQALIEGFARIPNAGARLVLVGPQLEPAYTKKLETLISTLGLTHRVILAGPLFGTDKLAALSAADIFVLPSIYESFGNAAAEAIAAGVPVVITTGCGIAPLVDGRAGLVVRPDSDGLARGLARLLENAALRASYAEGTTAVAEELSWQAPLDQAEAIYRDAASANTPAARVA